MSSSLSPRYASAQSDPVVMLNGLTTGVDCRPSVLSNESPSYFFRGERPKNKSSFHLTQKIVQAAKNHKNMQL